MVRSFWTTARMFCHSPTMFRRPAQSLPSSLPTFPVRMYLRASINRAGVRERKLRANTHTLHFLLLSASLKYIWVWQDANISSENTILWQACCHDVCFSAFTSLSLTVSPAVLHCTDAFPCLWSSHLASPTLWSHYLPSQRNQQQWISKAVEVSPQHHPAKLNLSAWDRYTSLFPTLTTTQSRYSRSDSAG